LPSSSFDIKAYYLCGNTGNPCIPSCRFFYPNRQCEHIQIQRDYKTFDELYWEHRTCVDKDTRKWKLFYQCFHGLPKKEGDSDGKKQFVVEFPHDIPLISESEVRINRRSTKDVDPDNPIYWSKEREDACLGNSAVMHRLASTDWDWAWYRYITRKGLKVDGGVARSKVEFDKIMFKLFGDNYEDEGTYTVKKTDPNFVKMTQLYSTLKSYIRIQINFEN